MEQLLFSSIPNPQSRWKLFLTSWSVQAAVLASLATISVMSPHPVAQARRFVVASLVAYEAPLPRVSQPSPRLTSRPVKLQQLPAPAAAPIVLPRVERTVKRSEIGAPEIRMTTNMRDIPTTPTTKVIAENAFATGKVERPVTSHQPEMVQTGGFGDPNGVPARDNRGPASIVASGFSDSPTGLGHGNGREGQMPSIVATTGFGNGIAGDRTRSGGDVRRSGFTSYEASSSSRKVAADAVLTIPVEIISKPKPDYTSEARELKIDGEVRLEVLFTTGGHVQVIKVVQGLGHGLDEQAVRAAEQIKFKPALHEGQPVDSTAVVHIVFQLVS
jgi:TonB family protein